MIKVIFQEIASGPQVTAQLAATRQTRALPFWSTPCSAKAERKEQDKSLWGAAGRSFHLQEERGQKSSLGLRAAGSGPGSRLARAVKSCNVGCSPRSPGAGFLTKNRGDRSWSPGPLCSWHCLERSVLGRLGGRRGRSLDTCALRTMPGALLPIRVFIGVANPGSLAVFLNFKT